MFYNTLSYIINLIILYYNLKVTNAVLVIVTHKMIEIPFLANFIRFNIGSFSDLHMFLYVEKIPFTDICFEG